MPCACVPCACGSCAWPRLVTRKVAGPSGVSDVRQIAPASSARKVGSPRPRPCTDSVSRTSSGNGTFQSRSALSHPTVPKDRGYASDEKRMEVDSSRTPGQTRMP